MVMLENESNLKETLFAFKDLMDDHGIEFVLLYGALLGAYRNKRLLPWDHDIDVEIIAKSYEDFVDMDIFGLLRDAHKKGFRHTTWAHEFNADNKYFKYPEIASLPEERQWEEFLKIDPNWKFGTFHMIWHGTNPTVKYGSVYMDCLVSIKGIHKGYDYWYGEQPLGKIALYGRTFNTPPDLQKYFSYYYGKTWKDIFCSHDLWLKYSNLILNGCVPMEVENFMKKWKPLLEECENKCNNVDNTKWK